MPGGHGGLLDVPDRPWTGTGSRPESSRMVATNDLAEALARLPGVVDAILIRHVPDEHGRCRACTTGGTGRPSAPWPCGLRWYANQATVWLDETR
jgi:hypothetical protein